MRSDSLDLVRGARGATVALARVNVEPESERARERADSTVGWKCPKRPFRVNG